jgi:hypothetical protein
MGQRLAVLAVAADRSQLESPRGILEGQARWPGVKERRELESLTKGR